MYNSLATPEIMSVEVLKTKDRKKLLQANITKSNSYINIVIIQNSI